MPQLITSIQSSDLSIITNESTIRLQKKIYPSLNSATTYFLDFGTKLKRNYYNAGVSSYPDFSVRDINSSNAIRTGVLFEEVPTSIGGVASINVVNQGFGYTKIPTVKITGDGIGATAYAVLAGGRVNSIVITDPGLNYTEAIVTITPASGDSSGALAFANATLEGSLGTLRTYYYSNNIKIILNSDAGSVDYAKGMVTLTNFAPIAINDPLGQFTISVVPNSTIVSSTFNKIVALDQFDPEAITVTVTASQ
jgi:hypothetical protein